MNNTVRRVSVVANPTLRHHVDWCGAMADGIRRHGHEVHVTPNVEDAFGDVAICWGWRIGQHLREIGFDVLVMERGYIGDRFEYSSLAWNGLNGRGVLNLPHYDPNRWETLFAHFMKPWRVFAGYTLLMGQVPGDSALSGVNIQQWYRDMAMTFDGEVMFRRHPMDCVSETPKHCQNLEGSLTGALQGASRVVTFNSSSGVDAVLAGVPTFVFDEGSMAWPVRATPLALCPDRTGWSHKLAWRQWSREEIASGDAWEVVKDAA